MAPTYVKTSTELKVQQGVLQWSRTPIIYFIISKLMKAVQDLCQVSCSALPGDAEGWNVGLLHATQELYLGYVLRYIFFQMIGHHDSMSPRRSLAISVSWVPSTRNVCLIGLVWFWSSLPAGSSSCCIGGGLERAVHLCQSRFGKYKLNS